MMELIMFGVVLTVSMVVASLIVAAVTMKLMTSKKFWKKYLKLINDITYGNLLDEDDEE